jgi:hypothetical protein
MKRAALFVLLMAPAVASAQLVNGQPITNDNYTVDLFNGPILAPTRITGLAGAYSAIAEGADGMSFNAAAPAVREPFSVNHVDYDLTAGFTQASSLATTDFDNNGTRGFNYHGFNFLTLGGVLQVGRFGIGLNVDGQGYQLGEQGDLKQLELSVLRTNLLVGYSFFRDQLVFGTGIRVHTIDADDGATQKDLFNLSAGGLQLGAVWAPKPFPFRFGATVRSAVGGSSSDLEAQPIKADGTPVSGLWLPKQLEIPADLEVGVALQLWKRPLNMGWTDWRWVDKDLVQAERRGSEIDEVVAKRVLRNRYRSRAREKVLVLASATITGPVADAVGVESMLSQVVERSGQKATVTPRLAVETEAIPGWLQVRAGTYYEPTRFMTSSPRAHITGGFTLKVLPWDVFGLFDEGTWFRINGAVDYTRDYFAWAVSIGVWR